MTIQKITIEQIEITEYPETHTFYVTPGGKRYDSMYSVPRNTTYEEETEKTGRMLERETKRTIYEQIFGGDSPINVANVATFLNSDGSK